MHVLTLIAPQHSGALSPALIARVTRAAHAAAPIILSPEEAIDLPCPIPPDPSSITEALEGAPIDTVLTGRTNRRKRLLIADMDSTIVTGETLDELAAFAGVGERVVAITARSMNGELDFAAALRERVGLLQGLPLAALEKTWAGVRLTPGARTLVQTMHNHGATTALVSGGFTWFTARVAQLCGFAHHRANILLDDGATLLGRVAEPILDREAKLATLKQLAATANLGLADCIAVGDGANDLAMLRAAGLGVAYHARPIVAAEAQARIEYTNLRALLFIQGYSVDEFVS